MHMQDEAVNSPNEETAEKTEEFLAFRLGDDEYAIPIVKVRELRAWQPVTRIPFAESWECGLINVRGAIVPVFDLRIRLGLANITYKSHTIVILLGIEKDGRERLQGVVADELTEVLQTPAKQIQSPSDLGTSQNLQLACGVVDCGRRMVVVLDLTKALAMSSK
jgi:purine-binding chemotaxis protein CheW